MAAPVRSNTQWEDYLNYDQLRSISGMNQKQGGTPFDVRRGYQQPAPIEYSGPSREEIEEYYRKMREKMEAEYAGYKFPELPEPYQGEYPPGFEKAQLPYNLQGFEKDDKTPIFSYDPTYYHDWVYNPTTGMVYKHLGRSTQENGKWLEHGLGNENLGTKPGTGSDYDAYSGKITANESYNNQLKELGWTWDNKYGGWVPPISRTSADGSSKWVWNEETQNFDKPYQKPTVKELNWDKIYRDYPYEEDEPVTIGENNTYRGTGRRYNQAIQYNYDQYFDPKNVKDEYYL